MINVSRLGSCKPARGEENPAAEPGGEKSN